MSGPIVRKYGFPNFEQIFGKRELEHGVDDPPSEADAKAPVPEPGKAEPKPAGGAKPGDPGANG